METLFHATFSLLEFVLFGGLCFFIGGAVERRNPNIGNAVATDVTNAEATLKSDLSKVKL